MNKKKLIEIAQECIDLQSRKINPKGSFDDGGRWYPETKFGCCNNIRGPSRAWPYSYLMHCRTISHMAKQYMVDEKELRKAVRAIRINLKASNQIPKLPAYASISAEGQNI